jgi:uncharacterized membrane protein YdfJ with MMPL/SSD domain
VHTTLPIPAYVPMLVFAIVFGLSMDYEVFLLSRVHEAWIETGDPHLQLEGSTAPAAPAPADPAETKATAETETAAASGARRRPSAK